MKPLIILLAILLAACIGLTALLVSLLYFSPQQDFILSPQTETQNNNQTINKTVQTPQYIGEQAYPNGLLFYPNMRFPDKKITYSIDSECSEESVKTARDGFSMLQEQTVLVFSEKATDGEIKVSCSEKQIQVQSEHEKEYFVAGEGGPLTIINSTRYYIILNGTILLYGNNKCDRPIVAVHETLHVLGFKHSSDKSSIMYNFSYCNQEIDPIIVSEINSLYKYLSLPDINIEQVNATKKGPYIDFEIELTNEGLISSQATLLSIYANDRKITDYEVESIGIGEGRILRVENLKVPLSTEKITFSIDPQDLVQELDKQNNEAILFLKSESP